MHTAADPLRDLLLTSTGIVVLQLDDAMRIIARHHEALLHEWCSLGGLPLPEAASLHDIIDRLLPGRRGRELLQTLAALSLPGSIELGTIALRAPHGAADRMLSATLHCSPEPQLRWLLLRETTATNALHQALSETRDALQAALCALRAHPRQLRLFLGSAMASVSAIRAMLRMPARTTSALQDKLSRLHAASLQLANESHELDLEPVTAACQRLGERITSLLQQPAVDGDALLPLAVLVDRIASAVAMAWRTEEQRHGEPAVAAARDDDAHAGRTRRAAEWAKAGERRWRGIVLRLSEENGTLAALRVDGARQVPASHRRWVDELLQHLLGNAVEHGIETPEQRLAAHKSAAGEILVHFERRGDLLCMTVRDDGRGFDESHRGRGINFLRRTVAQRGGQVSITTKQGQYTQFSLQFPAGAASSGSALPAA